ncbi:MAG: tetratricopeptide repeat protein [Elusimicrobiota bacterium]|jgi:hypothetical protein|nr:tetratricopeptide repeat protein [Elusimicrobiota bacterium]
MRIVLSLVFFIFLFPSFAFCAESPFLNQITNAQTAFKNGDYNKTVEIYETLIQVEKINNPFIYYNLSNAYYRKGDIGEALLNIEKAYKLSPRDNDIKNNRHFLLTMTGQNIDSSLAESATEAFSLNEITVLASASVILLLLFASAFLFFKKSIFKTLLTAFAVASIIFSSFTALKAIVVLERKAVILTPSIIKSGPKSANADLFNAPAAKIVSVLSSMDGWNRIVFKDSNNTIDGWIESDKIGGF